MRMPPITRGPCAPSTIALTSTTGAPSGGGNSSEGVTIMVTNCSVPGAMPYTAPMSREQEIDFLREEANAVKAQLEEIEARIKDLAAEQK